MKFEGITPEMVWANKESIFLVAIVVAFVGLLLHFKLRDKTHVGTALVTRVHMEGRERTKVYTINVYELDAPKNRILFTSEVRSDQIGMKNIAGRRPGDKLKVKYKKNPEGDWIIWDIAS